MEDADEGTESDVAKPSGGGGACDRVGPSQNAWDHAWSFCFHAMRSRGYLYGTYYIDDYSTFVVFCAFAGPKSMLRMALTRIAKATTDPPISTGFS